MKTQIDTTLKRTCCQHVRLDALPVVQHIRSGLGGLVTALFALASLLLTAPSAYAQQRPYIGFVYPAGGQQGTTFRIKLGGQGLEDVGRVFVTGLGVTAKVIEYNRVLGPQEITLLNEQLRDLKRSKTALASTMMSSDAMTASENTMMTSEANPAKPGGTSTNLVARIERRVAETVNRPASAALASITYVEVTIAPEAQPGAAGTAARNSTGPIQPACLSRRPIPETSRKPMLTAPLQVLGKEAQALRKRPDSEVEERVTLPCTVNGQIASGELNRYRFSARQGQKLVITTQARQLIPYIADAVPGWFQPVLALYDANGKEVAYDDDYRFKPDPTILYEVPEDGEYVLAIYDAIYRGREDFVYRITIGEVPFVTSIFPLGGRVGEPHALKMQRLESGESDAEAARTRDASLASIRSSPRGEGFGFQPSALRAGHPARSLGQGSRTTTWRMRKR